MTNEREPKSKYSVIHTLKEISQEADHVLDDIPADSAIDAWLKAVKIAFISIRDCVSVKDIEYPPSISSLFVPEISNRSAQQDNSDVQREHVHDKKSSPSKQEETISEDEKPSVFQHSVSSSKTPMFKTIVTQSQNNVQISLKESEANSLSKMTPVHKDDIRLTPMPVIKISNLKVIPILHTDNSQTPVMDKTFNTVSAANLDYTKTIEQPKMVNSAIRDEIITRSGAKRKSSVGNEESKKKRRMKSSKEVTTSSVSKSAHSKYNVEKSSHHYAKIAAKSSIEYKKMSAVIAPPIIKQAPVLSKGRQILEEIKKKEEKANENLKKVLAERQLKAEESKKKREEKKEKIREKRLQMEKEKEKREMDIHTSKSKGTKKTGLKPRVKELIEQNTKENTHMGLSPSKGSINADDIVKTPISQKMFNPNTESYDMTPLPDSSVYDVSDSEDEKPKKGKRVPLWAQGVALKSALIQQCYYPPNIEKIFGKCIPDLDLAVIFQVQKSSYKKRTSSCIWHNQIDYLDQ